MTELKVEVDPAVVNLSDTLQHDLVAQALTADEHPWSFVGERALAVAALVVLQALQKRPLPLADWSEDLFEQIVGRPAVRLGLEVQDDAMAERGQQQGANVLHADVEPSFEQRADLAAEDQCLCAARRTAVPDIFICQEIFPAFGVRRERKLHDIFLDVRR